MSSTRPIVPTNFQPFNIGMVQLGQIGPDKSANLAHARSKVLEAAQGAGWSGGPTQLVMLPEIFNSPTVSSAYRPNSEPIPNPDVDGPIPPARLPNKDEAPTLHMLSETAQQANVWLIGGSIPECQAGEPKIWNTSTVWDPAGNLVAKHRKVHLYDADFPGGVSFTESKSMSAGDKITVFTTPFGTIALAICFDIRFPQMLQYTLAQHPDVCAYLLPSAFNLSSGPRDWEILQRVRCYVSYGHTLLCSPSGQVISTSTPADETEAIVYARLEPEGMESARRTLPLWKSSREEVYTRGSQ